MHTSVNRSVRRARMGAMAAAAWLAMCSEVLALAADRDPVERALESAVRVEISLDWKGQHAVFEGSGWTRECRLDGRVYELVVATAGHVVDVPSLEAEAWPGEHPAATVRVVVDYRDGERLQAGREDLFVDPVHDYAEVHLRSRQPRTVLPTGVAAEVRPGARLVTVASPGSLRFAVFEGCLIDRDATMLANVPSGAWLSSIPVAPGASGAPVFNERGEVVATVVGFVQWPFGLEASVIVALPPMFSGSSTHSEMEVTSVGFLESLIPMLKLGGAAGVALALYHAVLPLVRRAPGFSSEALDMVMAICHTVVQAVEQAHGDLASIDKKALAQQMIAATLSHFGLQAPPTLVDAAIEAAVLALKRYTPAAAPASSVPAAA